jgi:hypothetical protein
MEHVSQAGQQVGDAMQGSTLSASFLRRQHKWRYAFQPSLFWF